MADSNVLEVLLRSLISTIKRAFAGKVDKHVFPSLTGPFKQAVVPPYSSVSALPTDEASVASAFNFGAWSPTAGTYVAFAFIGGHLNAVKATFDGTGTWAWGEATPLSLGCQVILEDSQEGHVYIATRETHSSVLRMYDVVKPIVGKIPLELANSGNNVSVNYLSNCDIKIHASSSTFITLTAYSTKDCSVSVDSSLIEAGSDGKARINFVSNGTAMRWPKPMDMTISNLVPGTWDKVGQAKNNFEFNPYSSGAVVQQPSGVPSGDPTTQLEISYKLKDPALAFDDGSKYRLNFQVDFINTTPEISFPMVYEEA